MFVVKYGEFLICNGTVALVCLSLYRRGRSHSDFVHGSVDGEFFFQIRVEYVKVVDVVARYAGANIAGTPEVIRVVVLVV